MPADLLYALFAVTLIANAVLVAAAIRSLRNGSGDRRAEGPERPLVIRPTAASAAPAPAPRAPVEPVDAPLATAPAETPSVDVAPAPAEPATSTEPEPAPRSPARTPDAIRVEPPADGGRRARGRRRFSLPPLDEDHEKVNRSIESFLGGIDPDDGDPQVRGADADPGGGQASVGGARRGALNPTVALIAVAGIPGAELPVAPRRNARALRRRHEDPAIEDALAVVERAIRSAARATDVVSIGSGGVFRVDLPATGELAARAYLRRVRATVDQVLETSERPLRLAIATATVLNEPIRDAVARAEVRLLAALEAARIDEASRPRAADEDDDDLDPAQEPRAAGD